MDKDIAPKENKMNFFESISMTCEGESRAKWKAVQGDGYFIGAMWWLRESVPLSLSHPPLILYNVAQNGQ